MSAILAPAMRVKCAAAVLPSVAGGPGDFTAAIQQVTITPVGVFNGAIVSIRPAENHHLDATILIFPFDPPVAGREPIFEYLGRLGHLL